MPPNPTPLLPQLDPAMRYSAAAVLRLCPVTLGHEYLLNTMLEKHGLENCLVMIGSANDTPTERVPLTYAQRAVLLTQVIPGLNIVPLPDFPSDQEWVEVAYRLMHTIGMDVERTIFYGGDYENIRLFHEDGRLCQVIERYHPDSPYSHISGTEVRERILAVQNVDEFINPKIRKQTLAWLNDWQNQLP